MFLYDMHVHTSEASGCANSTLEETIRAYKDAGYAGLVLTNHFWHGNTCIDRTLPWKKFIDGYSRAYFDCKNLAEKLDFDLLFGVEQGAGAGKEFLVYGIEPEFLRKRPQLCTPSLAIWQKELHEVGGVLIHAHPFRHRVYIPDPDAMPDMSIADGFEGVNYFNSPEENQKALDLLSAPGRIVTVGCDRHTVAHGIADPIGLLFEERIRDSKALADALKAGNYQLKTVTK